jgi:hypothetical protein
MPYVKIQTNASAAATSIDDLGFTVPGSAGSEEFDEFSWLKRIQASNDLRTLTTDDAHGAGLSTLELYDLAGQKVEQGLVETFLAQLLEDIPGHVARGSQNSTFNYVYVARTQTASANDSDPVWQIYRYDVKLKIRTLADGDANFDNVWDSTGGSGTPTYETLSYS